MDELNSPIHNESNNKIYYDENNKSTEFPQRDYTPLSSQSKMMKSPMGSQYKYGNIYDNQANPSNKGMVVPIQKIIPVNSTFRNKIVDFILNW